MQPLVSHVTQAHLELRLLGRGQVFLEGRDITAKVGAKRLALIAYLALIAPAPVAREQLVGIFWSDKPDQTARYRLRHILWELHHILGKVYIHADGANCWLPVGNEVWIDVLEFQRGCQTQGVGKTGFGPLPKAAAPLRALADLYHGDFLVRLVVRDAGLFEEWVLVERERLALLYQETLWCLAQAQQAGNDYAAEAQTLVGLIELDPWRERTYGALMGVYLDQGDHAAAMRVYHQCSDRLATDLGVSPSSEIERLRRAAQAPTQAAAVLQSAEECLCQGRYEDALAACLRAERLGVDPMAAGEIALLRAEIALAQGRPAEALALIQNARQARHHRDGRRQSTASVR